MKNLILTSFFLLCATFCTGQTLQLGLDYKATNSRYQHGAGLNAAYQFDISERLSAGPQAGMMTFFFRDVQEFQQGSLGSTQITTSEGRSLPYLGASAHWRVTDPNRKFVCFVGAGVNALFFNDSSLLLPTLQVVPRWFTRLHADLPITGVYHLDNRQWQLFARVTPSFIPSSKAHRELNTDLGGNIAMLGFQVGLQFDLNR